MNREKNVKRKVVIWGTGYEAEMLMNNLSMLKSWSDIVLAFCDNNADRKEYRGIKVVQPKCLDSMDIDFIVIATIYYRDILKQIERDHPTLLPHVVNRMLYESIVRSEDQYFRRCGKPVPANVFTQKTITVYTAIFGKYDSLEDPIFISDKIRYVCFTDNDSIKSDIWDIRVIDSKTDGVFKARHIKMFPDEYLDNPEITVWIDAKYRVIGNLIDYCKRYWRGNGMLCFPHFKWDSICDELSFLIGYRPSWRKEYVYQAADYLREGLPDEFDTFDTGCIVRESGNNVVDKIMKLWWDQLVKYNNPRDQIPFRYALWKTGFTPDISDLYIERNPFIEVSRTVN